MTATPQVVRVTMLKEKETLRTIRYEEEVALGDQPLVGKIYIKKTTLRAMGDPETLQLSLQNFAE